MKLKNSRRRLKRQVKSRIYDLFLARQHETTSRLSRRLANIGSPVAVLGDLARAIPELGND
jgi:transposase